MNGRIQKFDFEKPQSSIYSAIMSSLLWQYDNAPNLVSLITKKAQWYDRNYTQFWKDWFDNVFNLYTCDAFGITVWSIILDLPLQVEDESDPKGKPLWGFGPDVGSWEEGDGLNFDNSNFSNITQIQLSVEEKRFLLLLRYFQSQWNGSVLEVNKFLSEIVTIINNGSGTAYAIDKLNMSMIYYFTFRPRDILLGALKTLDILPRPTGVKIYLKTTITGDVFGFGPDDGEMEDGYAQNFNNGTFYQE